MIAQLRVCLSPTPDTFEQLILKFLRSLSKGYCSIDIVADTYRNVSIKSAEREKTRYLSKVLIGSIKSKLPRDMSKFMLNDDNKTALIKLIFDYVINEREERGERDAAAAFDDDGSGARDCHLCWKRKLL